ncbi:phage tail protein I [Sphingomonas sp. R647]|uniref:phage tail protein I n=1 Tax=Sphingomonas sp. R647 TaxID=2875233 RepID=UPI001CD2CC32|nr:phage tail protein I [Sphingomonas sp. R647]MCA1199137.1 phage tail protein I [Sphingomonas sp. R647]
MTDLLPPASTPLERTFANAGARIGDIPVDVATLVNPATCAINALPWLGWMLSVDRWQADWGDDQKREAVAGAIAAQRIKGTRLAVEEALQALDDLLQLVEWFEVSPNLPRHTFEVRLPLIDADGVAGGKRASAEFARQILIDVTRAKPVRAHFALVQQLELIGLPAPISAGQPVAYARLDMAATDASETPWADLIQTEDGEPLEDDSGEFIDGSAV